MSENGKTDLQRSSGSQHVTAAISSMIGTTIEWYDFFLYGIASALVFNKIFFPAIDPVAGTMAAFGTYAVGFLARPLGGIVFGHYGDRIGRKKMLMLSLMLMGIPTVFIGLTPSYDSIGYWGAAALILFRFFQGVGLGGEWGGAVLMAVEHAPEHKKSLFGTFPQLGLALGMIISSLAMGAVSLLPEEEMLAWGWRLPFLASAFMLVIGWYIRAKVAESPEFTANAARSGKSSLPLKVVLTEHKRPVVLAMLTCISTKTWFYLTTTFSLSYAVGTLGIPRGDILTAVIWGAVLALVTTPLFGLLGDALGKRTIFVFGSLGMVVFSSGFFALLEHKTALHSNLSMIVAFGLVSAATYSQESSLFSAAFPPAVRYTGISLAVQFGGAIGGGTAPLVATYLLAKGNNDPYLIIYYLAILGVLSAVCGVFMRAHDAGTLLLKSAPAIR